MVILNTLINDIFSYNKEVNGSGGNIIWQLQKHAKCSSAAAMAFLCDRLLDEKKFFDQNCERIYKERLFSGRYRYDRKVDEYIIALKGFLSANFKFCMFNDRYKIANDQAENLPF